MIPAKLNLVLNKVRGFVWFISGCSLVLAGGLFVLEEVWAECSGSLLTKGAGEPFRRALRGRFSGRALAQNAIYPRFINAARQ